MIRPYLKAGGIAIDATAGNGHDTVFLAKLVGDEGKIFAFDIQEQAIQSTRNRLTEALSSNNFELFHCSHEQMKNSIAAEFQGKISAIMFNLGYLPGGNKSLITRTESTLNAVQSALEILACPGIISITAYPGHAGGDEEKDALESFLLQLDSKQYRVNRINNPEKSTAPRLYSIEKVKPAAF